MASGQQYHLGFGPDDLDGRAPTFALLSGDPDRAALIGARHFDQPVTLSTHRGLTSVLGRLGGHWVLSATSGMGAPSASIVINELAQLGIRTIVRVGTTGSIQPYVRVGSVVISHAALCRQGAAADVAPVEFPAAADPFLTVHLADAARRLEAPHHVGVTASVDTFFEGQERTESSANKALLRRLQGITDEYRSLGVLNYEMEAGLLFKQSLVYGIAAGCVLAVVAERVASERVRTDAAQQAVDRAIAVAVEGARSWLDRESGR